MNKAVVFYSFEGNTKEAAQKISGLLKADLIEIKPVRDIPLSGPGKFLEGGFLAMIGKKSPILEWEKDPYSYDEIILGTPVWAGSCTPYVNNVVKDDVLNKKVTAVFTLSGSGNNNKCIKSLRKRLPNLGPVVSLVDRVGKASSGNKRKIDAFVKEIKDKNKTDSEN